MLVTPVQGSVNSMSQRESAEASVIPISPLVRKNREPPDLCNEVMGVDDEEEEVGAEDTKVPREHEYRGTTCPQPYTHTLSPRV